MLYLDSSALAKRYKQEKGSEAIHARFDAEERIFTSFLTYAEILTALGRAFRERQITSPQLESLQRRFLNDWLYAINILELNPNTMTALKDLVTRYHLRASDAVHLSTAIWMRDTARISTGFSGRETIVEFGVADLQLARVAEQCGLRVFNPEGAI